MRVMELTTFGGPGGFVASERDTPTPGPKEALVRVRATSLNPADVGVRSGVFGPMVAVPVVLGFDCSGVVEAVGSGVTGVSPGDEVYYAIGIMDGGGANAEYHVVSADQLARKPERLTHEEAGVIPVAGGTAAYALLDRLDLREGETLLIHGGGGGVGTFAVQIAHAVGARTFVTCGASDMDLVRSLGADVALDYRTGDFVETVMRLTRGRGVDAVLTTVGGDLLARSLPGLREEGRAATIIGVEGDLNLAMRKNHTIHFAHLERSRPVLERLNPWLESGAIRPVICRTFPLERLAEAHAFFDQGGPEVYGKVGITV